MRSLRLHGPAPSLAGILLGLALLLSVCLSGPAVAAPGRGPGSPSLVFSEVYAPIGGDVQAQWFEIHNTQPSFAYPLTGLILATGGNQLTLKTPAVIAGGGYALFIFGRDAVARGLVQPVADSPVVPVPELGGLDPQHDALILYTPDKSIVIDEVNWGRPDPSWVNAKAGLWDPGLDPLQDPARSWGRTPVDRDTNQARPPAGDWTIHEVPTPGGRLTNPTLTPFLGRWTDVAGGLGSLLLWTAFVIVAAIAYGIERVRDTPTYWQVLLLAPSGLLFYTAIVVLAFSRQEGGALTPEQQWLAFPVLAISALLCLIAVGILRNVVRTVLEGERL